MNENANDLFRLHILVTGRVQNVGFRAFVQQVGSQLALTGWVRNVNYNQVEIEAEGGRPALEEFAGMINTGPRGSRVEGTNVEWETATGEFVGFIIRTSR